jgi:RimJ/RimL family protein N-acetyltransferase
VKSPFLVGERIYLRPLDRADAPLVQPWLNDPAVRRTILNWRPLNLEAEEGFIDRMSQSEHDVVLGIALRADDRLIGVTGLHHIDYKNSNCEYGLLVGEKAEWGHGYGSEACALLTGYAFDTLNLHRVWLGAYEHNAAAIHIYEKVGYRREGVLRDDKYNEGRYFNVLLMAILRDEWKAR